MEEICQKNLSKKQREEIEAILDSFVEQSTEEDKERIKLKAIGYWQSDDESTFHHPGTFIGQYESETVKNAVVKYLDSGQRLSSWMGYSYCRFNCGMPEHKMGDSDLTDGVWVWPEGLSHYVKEHNVMVPKDFIIHAQKNSWNIPEKDFDDDDYTFDYTLCEQEP